MFLPKHSSASTMKQHSATPHGEENLSARKQPMEMTVWSTTMDPYIQFDRYVLSAGFNLDLPLGPDQRGKCTHQTQNGSEQLKSEVTRATCMHYRQYKMSGMVSNKRPGPPAEAS